MQVPKFAKGLCQSIVPYGLSTMVRRATKSDLQPRFRTGRLLNCMNPRAPTVNTASKSLSAPPLGRDFQGDRRKGQCGNKLDSHANCGLVWSWQRAARDENTLREEQNIDEPGNSLGGIGLILTSPCLPFSPTKSFSPLRRSHDG
jgi:hypothetical protein